MSFTVILINPQWSNLGVEYAERKAAQLEMPVRYSPRGLGLDVIVDTSEVQTVLSCWLPNVCSTIVGQYISNKEVWILERYLSTKLLNLAITSGFHLVLQTSSLFHISRKLRHRITHWGKKHIRSNIDWKAAIPNGTRTCICSSSSPPSARCAYTCTDHFQHFSIWKG
jgi:hypothetical protein